MNHIVSYNDEFGPIPLCGRADWYELVADDSPDNECWECASIVSIYTPELQERFGVNADGSARPPTDG